MPYANDKIVGEEWKTCDRCGFIHPVPMLSRKLGLMLCRCHQCSDDISNDRRPAQIQAVLATSAEGKSDWAERLKDKGEVIFDGNDT